MQKTRNGRSRPETHVRRPRRGPNCIRLYATGGPVVYKLYTIVYTREASCIQFVYNWARRARKNSRIVYKLYTILIQPDSRLQNPSWTLPPLIQFPCKFCKFCKFCKLYTTGAPVVYNLYTICRCGMWGRYNPYTTCRLARLYTDCIQFVCGAYNMHADCIQIVYNRTFFFLCTGCMRWDANSCSLPGCIQYFLSRRQLYTICIQFVYNLPSPKHVFSCDPFQIDPSGEVQMTSGELPQPSDCIQIV